MDGEPQGIASSIATAYNFPRPLGIDPTPAQIDTCVMLTSYLRSYVLNELGTGKTACILWAFDYLRSKGMARKMLVTGPLSSLKRTWMSQIFMFTPHLTATVLHGTAAYRRKQLARKDVDIYIVNHDGVGTVLEQLRGRTDIDVLALDELAVYRNRGKKGGRTREMQALQAQFRWVWGVTGSPMPNAPTDVWNQCKIVTPWRVPKHWGIFREELMLRVSPFKWLPKRDAIVKAYKVMQPAVRFTLDDVPAFASQRVEIEMGPRQKLIYETMRKHSFALVEKGAINAVNGGALLSKLLQISLGYVYTEKRGVQALDNENRLDAMCETVEASAGKVIVFTAFKHSLSGIAAALAKAGLDVAPPISGDVPVKQRDEVFAAFQDTDRYKVLPAHPACMAHSLTLTRADTIIWFGPLTSLDHYDQANGRIRRLGQTRRQLFAHFQSSPVERKLYDALIAKQISQFNFLELFVE